MREILEFPRLPPSARRTYLLERVVPRARGQKTFFGTAATPYLRRYTLWNAPGGGHLYLHHFLRGDEDAALHSHPWFGVGVILVGGYREQRRMRNTIRERVYASGALTALTPRTFHRVELLEEDCWTLFLTSPKRDAWRRWSFWNPATGVETPWDQFIREKGLDPLE